MSQTLGEAIVGLRATLVAAMQSSDDAALDRAVELSDQVAVHPSFVGLDPSLAAMVWSLGGSARIQRNRIAGRPADLDDAISWYRRALEAAGPDDTNQPAYQSNLATILVERYERDHHRSDLDAALGLFKAAVPQLRASGAAVTTTVHNQGLALLELYQADQEVGDLEDAIACFREAAADTTASTADRGGYLNSLGQALRTKAAVVSDPDLLEEAVEALREARQATGGSVDHVAALVSLGNTLLDRYELAHSADDLTEAVACLEESLELAGETTRAARIQSNLGNALLALFRETGDQATLQRARELFESAVGSFAPSTPERAACINNLAACLLELYGHTGQLSFLDDAIGRYDLIVDGPERVAVNAERYHNFGIALLSRYKRTDSGEDLDRAIQLLRNAVRAFPDRSAGQAAAANSLGNALFLRYDRSDDLADLEASITTHRQAASIPPEGSVDQAMYRANLGVGLLVRGQRRGSLDDVEAAIGEQKAAAARVSDRSPEFVRLSAALAGSLAGRAVLAGDAADVAPARAEYRRAVSLGLTRVPEQALGSADEWGQWAASRRAFSEAAEAYGYGLGAMEQLFRIQLTRAHKESWLRDAQGLAIRGGYARARARRPAGAVEALEGGRALLLSEVLELDRAELDGLVAADRADLRDRYEQSAGRWNQLSGQATPLAEMAGGGPVVRGEVLTEELRKARDELEATIAEIRKVAGYERFLLAPSFSDICGDAGEDPLVYLGATELGGLALVVWPSEESVKTLWLPTLTEEAVAEQVRGYRDTYRTYRQSRRPQDRIAWEEAIDEVTAWLWRAVMGKVLKALGNAPRATLVPAGLLGVLPLHAAWTPHRGSVLGRRYALDDITLSYTPNARALGAARTLQDQVQGEHLVAVDEPAIGGGKELALPYSSVEVGAAAATFPDRELLPGEEATQRRVVAALAGAQVFHLSCHGHADLVEPLHSALAMARDEPPVGVEPLTLEELMRVRLQARLGVLSACETGIPGDELPDEVVSLPTGLLQAGTGGVVASLWSVPERATAMLMFRFYEGWRVEHLAPSAALRQAQRWVRDTTNGDKVAYFRARRPGSDHPMASAAAQSLWRELFGADPAARDHRRPYHWAAFAHIGG